jgi:DNA-directed RNA polymerase subunit RPC12/RpoP
MTENELNVWNKELPAALTEIAKRADGSLQRIVSGIRENAIPCPECGRHGLYLMYQLQAYAHRKEDLLRYVACHYCRERFVINDAANG